MAPSLIEPPEMPDKTKLSSGPPEAWQESPEFNGDVANGSRVPPHPLAIKPRGNKYLSAITDARESLGNFGALPDEVLMQLLEYMGKHTLRLLGHTCKFLFAFCRDEELWKALFLE